MSSVSTDGFGTLFSGFSRAGFGAQTSWAIDATLGNDSNVGTPAAPLQTMEEFNLRMQGATVQSVTTLSLVGDVIDAPLNLVGTRFRSGATLTVTGTKTQVGSGTISTVTPIGVGGTTYPWQLATTGIDWTTINAGAQILLQGGQVGFIHQVVNANTVVVGALSTLTSNTAFTPTNGLTFTVSTLSRGTPPVIHAFAVGTAAAINIQNLKFTTAAPYLVSGVGVIIAGCELEFTNFPSIENAGGGGVGFIIRACRFTCTSGTPVFRSSGRVTLANCLFVAGSVTSISLLGQDHFWQSLSFFRVGVILNFAQLILSTGGMHFDTISGTRVLQIDFRSVLYANGTGAIANGRNCSASFGVDVSNGEYVFNGAANKPTLGIASGCSGDIRLGVGATGVGFTYAALGTGKQTSFTDAAPNTVTQISGGGGSAMYQLG